MRADALRDARLTVRDGRTLGWCEYGDGDGWPVMFQHGMPGSRFEHPPDVETPRRRGLRIIVPDRPGYGGTSPKPGRTLADVAEDVAALADHLGVDTFDLVGFSCGGPHALACASRLPGHVRRVGLASSLGPLEHTGTRGMGDANRQLWELAQHDFSAFGHALQEAIDAAGDVSTLFWNAMSETDRAVLADEKIEQTFYTNFRESMRQGLTGMLEDAQAATAPWPFDVSRIFHPVWLWHGDHDLNAPLSMGQWLAHNLPRATLTEWTGKGHYEVLRRWNEMLDPFAYR